MMFPRFRLPDANRLIILGLVTLGLCVLYVGDPQPTVKDVLNLIIGALAATLRGAPTPEKAPVANEPPDAGRP